MLGSIAILILGQDTGWAQTIVLRPTAHSAVSNVTNPHHAYDTSIYSTAGASMSRICHRDCLNQTLATGVWDGFPSGYRPATLEVKWKASAAHAMYGGDQARVHVKLEADLGAGWETVEEEIWQDDSPNCPTPSNGGLTCADHVITRSLNPEQHSGTIRVRATLTVQILSCGDIPMCSVRVSNVSGSFSIADIRIIAAPPVLTITPAPVMRGASATFEIRGAPGASISNWVYSTVQHGSVTRVTNTGSATWSGVVVAAGTATVQVLLQGTTYNLSEDLQVTARNWLWTPVSPQQVPNGTFATLASPPVPNGALGMMEIAQPYTYNWAVISDDGPNHGFKYLTSAGNAATFKYEISPDLENTSSAFYQAQCGTYNTQNPTGFISGSQLLSNTREHEFGTTLGHYIQYVTAQNDPNNNLGVGAELQVAGPAVSGPSFTASVEASLNSRSAVIGTATISDSVCNSDVRYDPSCAFRGLINFAPYTPC